MMADDKTPPPADGIMPGGPPFGSPPPAPAGPPYSDQIVADPQPRIQTTTPPARPSNAPGPNDMKDGTREVVETIVFVVVLVLLLKTFLAEAFVIPTGSMATTLLGYHVDVECSQCKHRFTANAANWADPQDGDPVPVFKAQCPNCLYVNNVHQK